MLDGIGPKGPVLDHVCIQVVEGYMHQADQVLVEALGYTWVKELTKVGVEGESRFYRPISGGIYVQLWEATVLQPDTSYHESHLAYAVTFPEEVAHSLGKFGNTNGIVSKVELWGNNKWGVYLGCFVFPIEFVPQPIPLSFAQSVEIEPE